MRRGQVALYVFVGVALVLVAVTQGVTGDYGNPWCDVGRCDPQPAIQGLARGDWEQVAHLQPAMGPVTLVARVPAYWAADAFDLGLAWEYQLGVLICLLPLFLVAIMVSRRMHEPDVAVRIFIVAALAFNPAIFSALDFGHPEELTATGLVIAALILAAERKALAASVVLALAVATKQWAVLAFVPMVALTAPGARLRTAAITAGIAAALLSPLAVANPGGFSEAVRSAAAPDSPARAESVWWRFADQDPDPNAAVNGRVLKSLDDVARTSAAVVLGLVLIAGTYLLRRRFGLSVALRLLALTFLLRCMLDPYNLPYYHAAFLAALLASEALSRARIPGTALAGVALFVAWMQLKLHYNANFAVRNVIYLVWTIPFAAVLARQLWTDRLRPLGVVASR